MDDVTEDLSAEYEQLSAQFASWFERKTTQDLSFNRHLLSRRDFHNPNIGSKLLSFVGLEEGGGSNLPSSVFDPKHPIPFDYHQVATKQRRDWEERGKR